MRSGTSFFNGTLFKKNITRFWPIWGSYLALWLLLLPMSVAAGASLSGRVRSALVISLITAAFWGLFSAMAVLSHLYSTRSVNLYGALPLRREGIFLTQYISGLLFTLGPNLIVSLLLTLAALAREHGPAGLAPVLVWLVMTCAFCLFFYSLAVLCGMLTGHILALPALYLVVNFAAPVLAALISELLRRYLWGYAGVSDRLEDVILWLTPTIKMGDITIPHAFDTLMSTGEAVNTLSIWPANTWYILAYSAAALVMAALALLLYRRRSMERAGDVIALGWLRPVFKYASALCVALAMGQLTCLILGDMLLEPFLIIWGVAGYFAAQMLLEKSFRVWRSWPGAAVTAAVLLALVLTVSLDLTGFEDRVPSPDSVRSVRVEIYDINDRPFSWVDFTTSSPAVIEDVLALHSSLTGGRYSDGCYLSVEVTYTTALGRVRRQYYTSYDPSLSGTPGATAWALERLYSHREIWMSSYEINAIRHALENGASLAGAEYTYNLPGDPDDPDYVLPDDPECAYDYLVYGLTVKFSDPASSQALLDAVESDILDGRIGLSNSVPDAPSRFLSFTWTVPGTRNVTYSPSIYIPPTPSRTLSLIHSYLTPAFMSPYTAAGPRYPGVKN